MNLQLLPTTTAEAEETLEDLAEELEIPPYRYEQAEASYKSLGRWLNRENSRIRQYGPQVHVQGSFGLGTVIPPITDDEHYDVDPVISLPPDQGSGQPDPANAALTHGGIDLRPRKCRGGPALLRNATITIAARGAAWPLGWKRRRAASHGFWEFCNMRNSGIEPDKGGGISSPGTDEASLMLPCNDGERQ